MLGLVVEMEHQGSSLLERIVSGLFVDRLRNQGRKLEKGLRENPSGCIKSSGRGLSDIKVASLGQTRSADQVL